MNIHLAPYNYYVLYIAIGLTLITIVYLLKQLLQLGKAVSQYDETFKNMQTSSNNMQTKLNIIQEDVKKTKQKTQWIWKVLPIAITTYHIYKEHDELHGVKGYGTAATMALKRSQIKR